MQGLLNFCIEQTKTEDAPADTPSLPPMTMMTQDRREWLQGALNQMVGTDPVKLMLELVKTILDHETQDEDREEALEELQMHCEDLDLARDFHKIGGYSVVLGLLSSDSEGLRWRTADLVATLVQNNPYCQQAALDSNLMERLLSMVDSTDTDLVRTKAVYGLSCLCRECPAAQDAMIAQDGFSVLMRAMQSNVEKLQIKSSFLLAALCIERPALKDILCDMGMVEQLIALLHTPHNNIHEHLTCALLNLTQGHQRAQEECRRPELRFRELLKNKMPLLKGKEECMEELDYSEHLYKLCFPDSHTSSAVDR